jgi:hypothetical protein
MKTNIVVKLQYEATHNWPKVAEVLPDLPEIHFLQYPHRHIFHITMEKPVEHSDRDVEIILFKREVLKHLHEEFYEEFDNWSCEMIAEYLLKEYGCYSVEVLEDNENGAKVYSV